MASNQPSPIADLADRVCRVFVPVVLAIALATGVLWWINDPSATGLPVALQHFVAVLVVACPCALGLATPAAVAVGTGRGAELGVLISRIGMHDNILKIRPPMPFSKQHADLLIDRLNEALASL